MNRDEITKALECCFIKRSCCVAGCPYYRPNTICNLKVGKDAFDLLKETEPIKKDDMYFCGECKNALATTWAFCPKCGRKVKWKDDDPSHPFADDVMMHVEENEDD